MRPRLTSLVLAGGVALGGAGAYGVNVLATPGHGFEGETLASGRFETLHLRNKVKALDWKADLQTQGPSDLYVQSNLWHPKSSIHPNGTSTGWHTHPGYSLIIVTEGTLTAYDAEDPSCSPRTYSAGQTIVDPGGDHVHLLRNDETVAARTITVQLIPGGATRRIDEERPPHCSVQ